MPFKKHISKKGIVETISMLFILLFVYASVSKILDFENFRVQLAQSPLLSAYSGWVTVIILGLEVITVFLMIIPKSKLFGLYLFYTLMILFSIYICFILNVSPYLPCSCGGVLEKMSWTSHLIFNIVFILLALIVIYLLQSSLKKIVFRSLFIILGSISLLYGLYRSSESIIHKRNPFIRKFIPHHARYINSYNLSYNSYYIAGYGNGNIFLGNSTAPLHVLQIDSTLQNSKTFQIKPNPTNFNFKRLFLKVSIPKFYLYDGQVPVVYQGDIKNWKAEIWNQEAYFTLLTPADSNLVGIRGIDIGREMNVLGVLSDKKPRLKYNSSILKKQIDGMFDTDGILLYSRELRSFIYTYYYINQYVVTNKKMSSFSIGRTIDTVSKAKLIVSSLKSSKLNKIASPTYVINEAATTYKEHLYIVSGTIGRYEKKNMWKQASIIDVYSITNNTYDYSFYVYHPKIRDFIIYNNQLFFIKENTLHHYSLKK